MALILFLQTNINISCEHWKVWYANSSKVIRVFKAWWRPMRTLQMRAQANILTNPVTLGGRDQTNFTVFQGNCHSRNNQACCNEISNSHRVSAGRVISDYSTRWLPGVFVGQNTFTPSTAIISSTLEDFILMPSFSQSGQEGLQSLSQQNKNRRGIKARWIQSTPTTQSALPRNSPVVQSMVHCRISL